jgi:hypothetical protein
MRYLAIYRPNKKTNAPTGEEMAKMGAFIEELTKAGVLVATDGRKEGGKDLKVRLSKGEFTVTDGPFAETKEIIGGFALLEVKSREQLIDLSKRFLKIAGDGESEILEMFGGG